MEKKSKISLQKRDPEELEVYKAEFLGEVPAGEIKEKSEIKPVSSTIVKILGNLGSLAMLLLKTTNFFNQRSNDSSGKKKGRLRRRRKG